MKFDRQTIVSNFELSLLTCSKYELYTGKYEVSTGYMPNY